MLTNESRKKTPKLDEIELYIAEIIAPIIDLHIKFVETQARQHGYPITPRTLNLRAYLKYIVPLITSKTNGLDIDLIKFDLNVISRACQLLMHTATINAADNTLLDVVVNMKTSKVDLSAFNIIKTDIELILKYNYNYEYETEFEISSVQHQLIDYFQNKCILEFNSYNIIIKKL